MKYKITNKTGFTPQSLQGIKTHAEVMAEVRSFITCNKPRKPLADDTAKIAYYNRRSFYKIATV